MGSDLPDLGVVTPLGYGNAPSTLRDYAVRADRCGVRGIQVGELASTEAFALVAAMAVATSRIRIDTAIIATLTRSPALLAMGAATLADLSGGRFVLGLGAGSPVIAGWHGKEFPARPRTEVVSMVEDVRAALGGKRLAKWGDFRLTGIQPRPDVPIFVSAMNNQMLRAAGRSADGVVVNFCSVERAAEIVPLVRAARAEAGVDAPFEFVANVWAQAGTDLELAQRRLRWEIAPYLAVQTYRAAAVAIADEAAVERAGAAWSAGGRDAAAPLVPQELVDSLVISGDTAAFAKRLAEFRAVGVDTVRLVPLTSIGGGMDAAHAVVDLVGDLTSAGAAMARTT